MSEEKILWIGKGDEYSEVLEQFRDGYTIALNTFDIKITPSNSASDRYIKEVLISNYLYLKNSQGKTI